MLRAMLRDLRAHKGRIAMTLVAIVLGVAFVVATWVLSDSTAASLTGRGSERSTVDVVAQSPASEPVLTEDDLTRLSALPGVRRATGVLAARASLIGTNGKIISGVHEGTAWDNTDRFSAVKGRPPTSVDELALSQAAANSANLHLGSQARVILADGQEIRARVVALFDYRTLGEETTPSVAFAPKTAHKFLGSAYDRVELEGRNLAPKVRAALPDPRIAVHTGAELAAKAREEAESAAASTRESLLAFAAVALLVGMFVIANTFTMLVTQRVRQFALLRAVGATRRQVRRAVVLEAGALGLVGATIGVAAGITLGLLGMWAFTPEDQPVTYTVSPLGILAGYAVGIGVTVVAAYGSARRAAAVPPVAALRVDASPPRRNTLVRTTAGTALLIGGAATVAATAGPNLSTTERVVCMGAGVAGWLGVLLLAPAFASAVLSPLSRLLSRRGSPAVRLATRNAVRDPRRTAATSSALLVGLALVCAFATLGETMVATTGAAVRNMVPPDTTILRPASEVDPLSADVLDHVRTTPGVTRVAADRYSLVTVSYSGGTAASSISAIEPDGFTSVLTPELVAGTSDLHRGVVVDTNQAAMLGLKLGDDLAIEFPNSKPVHERITGLIDTVEGQPLIYVDVAKTPKWFHKNVTSIYATGPTPTAVREALDKEFQNRPDVLVTDREGVIATETADFQLILAVMYAMFGAAIVIAIFGVINTLALSVTERTRELGVLRAIGAPRRLIHRTIRTESLVICTYGGALGIAVGCAFGAIMQHTMLGNPLQDTEIPTTTIATALLGMLTVGVLSALWPARRAARTNILTATQTE